MKTCAIFDASSDPQMMKSRGTPKLVSRQCCIIDQIDWIRTLQSHVTLEEVVVQGNAILYVYANRCLSTDQKIIVAEVQPKLGYDRMRGTFKLAVMQTPLPDAI